MIEKGIIKKLLIKSGNKIGIINAPEGIDVLLDDPQRRRFFYNVNDQFDTVIMFVHGLSEAEKFIPKALKCLKKGAIFWAAYPKVSSKIKTDINRDKGWNLINEAGYEGVSIISMDQTWSAIRFVEAGKTTLSEKSRKDPSRKNYKFEATLIDAGDGGVFVNFPYSVQEEFGMNGLVKIKCTIDGEAYKGALANMGTGNHILIVVKSIREKIGKQSGDSVKVVLVQYNENRVVTVPLDLQNLLSQNTEALIFFEKLSYTHKKEYVRWIEEAKKIETRAKRLEKSIAMLLKGKKGI